MPFASGEHIGPYEVVEEIGKGGMATVFKAYHNALERHVAIKVMRPNFTDDVDFMGRFRREARVLAKFNHPNIIPIYDYAEYEGLPYIVMRFVEGETLKQRIERGPMPLPECAQLLGAVGAALQYAHRRGILHRDLKPSNILLEKEGDVLLADFGLARLTAMETKTLSVGMILGSPFYMSPEQGLEQGHLDAQMDQYALGIITFEMLTGRLPFNSSNAFSVIHDHISTPPPRPSAINAAIPTAIDAIVLQTLAKDPKKRFPTIMEFVQAFQRAVAPPRPPTAPLPTNRDNDATDRLVLAESVAEREALIMIVVQPGDRMIDLKGKREYWIGRSEPNRAFKPDVDFVELRGLDLGVSRTHGRLFIDDRRLYYCDLNSSNGSRLNGVRLRPDEPVELTDGDELTLGKMGLRLYFAF